MHCHCRDTKDGRTALNVFVLFGIVPTRSFSSPGCCDLPRPVECKPPPVPNPATVMPSVTVAGAVEIGAVTPRGEAPTIEFNSTGSKGWVIHMSGGGWGFRKNTTTAGGRFRRDGAPLYGGGSGEEASLFLSGSAGTAAKPAPAPPPGCYLKCDGIMSADPDINPMFHEFNKVFIPINDGTSFTGDLAEPIPASNPPVYPNKWPIYIRGGRIVTAVMSFLMKDHGMAGATEVIITGGSSGGMAVYLNCDRIADQIHTVNPKIRVTCLADAGMFLDHPGLSGEPTLSPNFVESFYAWNSSAMTNQACITHYTPLRTPWKCIFSQCVRVCSTRTARCTALSPVFRWWELETPDEWADAVPPRSDVCDDHCRRYVLPFIKTPLFVAQNLYDSYQLGHILTLGGCSTYGKDLSACPPATVAAIQAYGATMRGIINDGLAAPGANRGSFAPSCIAHCQTVANEHPAALWNWPARWGIHPGTAESGDDAVTPELAFAAWYEKGAGAPGSNITQACDFGCNPKCPLYT